MTTVINTIDHSRNSKLGGMPATTASGDTCPPSCSLRDSEDDSKSLCYWYSGFRTKAQAKRLVANPEKYKTPSQFVGWVQSLQIGQIWRDRIGGDQVPMANNPERINPEHFVEVALANNKAKAKGFGFTHYNCHDSHNANLLRFGYAHDFVLNASTDSVFEAEKLKAANPDLSIVTVASADYTAKDHTSENGTRFVMCPNSWNKKITCKRCKLCAVPNRDYVIVFTAHGTHKRKAADLIASSK